MRPILVLALPCLLYLPRPSCATESAPAPLRFPACANKTASGYLGPKTIDAMMTCQWAKRSEFVQGVRSAARTGRV